MKKFKRVILFVLLGVSLFVSGNKINSDIREIKWHNAGHTPAMNGEAMKKVGDYFLAESTNKQFSVYVSRNFIEANKYCRVCQEKESVLYRIFTVLGIVKEQQKTVKSNLCESDYGITVNN